MPIDQALALAAYGMVQVKAFFTWFLDDKAAAGKAAEGKAVGDKAAADKTGSTKADDKAATKAQFIAS